MHPRIAVLAAFLATSAPAFAGTFFVDANLASGANDGSTWADAFQGSGGLQLALAAANAGDQVWVADGTYVPTSTAARTISFNLESGVEIYGGFAGGEGTLAERDPAVNIAVLSGDLLGDDVGFTNNAENSFHVVRGTGANATAILDGFTVSGGNANGAANDDRGGGFLFLGSGQATIVNCLVQGNRCTFGGGAGYISASSPTFTLCRFVGNVGGAFGGAFDMASGVASTFRRCIFTGNSAARAGGIEIFGGSPVKVYDCIFTGNTSTGTGGGGAIFISSSSAAVRGCTITGNFSSVNATAGILVSGAGATIANSIVYFNSGPGGAQGTANQIAGAGQVSYSCVQGGIAGTGNVSGDPMFINAVGGDYTLASGTPCADSGNNAAVPAVSTTDRAGLPRISDDPVAADTGSGTRPIVDMGAFERQNALYETFCFGDGTLATPCPCGNNGLAGHGCLNSDFFSTGGVAWATGATNPDTVAIAGAELRVGIACIVLQGSASIPAGTPYGDGVRCVGGTSRRLYTKSTDANGAVLAPELGDPSITARSAAVGDPIAPGSLRHYQIWYRDAKPSFCAPPVGDAWNVSSGVTVSW
ncbi:MAG: right-handed parallel beta-helix repeat-containing protein [Planctomycetota bacterium]